MQTARSTQAGTDIFGQELISERARVARDRDALVEIGNTGDRKVARSMANSKTKVK
jgi:hypothetical protein